MINDLYGHVINDLYCHCHSSPFIEPYCNHFDLVQISTAANSMMETIQVCIQYTVQGHNVVGVSSKGSVPWGGGGGGGGDTLRECAAIPVREHELFHVFSPGTPVAACFQATPTIKKTVNCVCMS